MTKDDLVLFSGRRLPDHGTPTQYYIEWMPRTATEADELREGYFTCTYIKSFLSKLLKTYKLIYLKRVSDEHILWDNRDSIAS
jgi:hypothetical protein